MTHDDWLFTQGTILGLIIGAQLVEGWMRRNYVMYKRKRTAEGKDGGR